MGEHRNLTLAVDGELLDRVRVVAAERRTSVTGLVRDSLRALAAAAGAGCAVLYAEDMAHGRAIRGVRSQNPFVG